MTTERAQEFQARITREALALMVIHGESVSTAAREEDVSVAHFEEAVTLIGKVWNLPAEATKESLDLNALARQAKKEDMTVEEKLEDCLDALIEQLPERVRDRVSREVWEEHQRELEASRRCSVLRITQDGRTDHLLTEGVASLDALHAAVRLRSFLLSKVGQPSLKFAETLHGTVDIAPEVFREHAEELRQGAGQTVAALDINLDRSEFSMLDTEGVKYAVPDVLSALWHSQRNPALTSEQQQTIFDSRLDGLEIYTPEAPDMAEESSPTMGLSL